MYQLKAGVILCSVFEWPSSLIRIVFVLAIYYVPLPIGWYASLSVICFIQVNKQALKRQRQFPARTILLEVQSRGIAREKWKRFPNEAIREESATVNPCRRELKSSKSQNWSVCDEEGPLSFTNHHCLQNIMNKLMPFVENSRLTNKDLLCFKENESF